MENEQQNGPEGAVLPAGQAVPVDSKDPPSFTPTDAEPPDGRQQGPAVSQLLPLAATDNRFKILREATLRNMRKGFIKLFKRTSDKDSRFIIDEMAVFLAFLTARELLSIIKTLSTRNSPEAMKEIMAQHDPVKVFTKTFLSIVTSAINEKAEGGNEGIPSNPEGVREVDGAMGEAGSGSDSGSEPRSE
jgi:hypothetical protein